MDQYQRANAVHRVGGYYVRILPTTTPQVAFLKAQAECARELQIELAQVERLTFEQFAEVRKSKMDASVVSHAVYKVDGYYLRIHPTAKPLPEFLEAQAECARQLRAQLSNIESLTFAQFAEVKKLKVGAIHE